MLKPKSCLIILLTLFLIGTFANPTSAWHDETHIAIAKVAGYYKWYNAAGADIATVKAGKIEGYNHYSNNPPGTVITPEMVLAQAVARKVNKTNNTSIMIGTKGRVRRWLCLFL